MKRKITKILAAFALLLVSSLPMKTWADELTLDLSSATGWTITSAGTSSTGSDVEMSKDGITITANKGYWAGNQLRVYSGSTFVVTSSIGDMSQISLTFTGGKEGPLSGYTNGTATITPAASSFSSTASGQARIVEMVITYTPGGGTQTVATPTFSPGGGAYYETQNVTINCSTSDATIYYTMGDNPDDPTSASTEYTEAIEVSASTTIKAIAVKNGMNDSQIASATYTISEVTNPWNLVTSADDLTAGSLYVIACNTQNAVASATMASSNSGKWMTKLDATFSSDKSIIPAIPEGAAQLVLGISGNNYTFSICWICLN